MVKDSGQGRVVETEREDSCHESHGCLPLNARIQNLMKQMRRTFKRSDHPEPVRFDPVAYDCMRMTKKYEWACTI